MESSFTQIEGINAVLRYHYRIDPDDLDDDDWLKLYAEYRLVRKNELKEYEAAVHNALAEVVNKLLAKGDGINNNTMDPRVRG